MDEREDVQKKTFAKWINSQLLKNQHDPITDLFLDLRDGNRLLSLLEVLTSKSYKRERGRMRVHHLNNVNKALQILEQNNVKLVNISSNDIVDGNPKLTLGLVWSIILHWQVHYHLKDLMTELQQTNLEKTLLAWCCQIVQNYEGVDIKNFTTSWSDGLAFNALLHKWKPQLFDFNSVARKHPNARLDHAFRLAQEILGIERLLDPEDVNTSVPDKKSILMYVTCLFQSLPHSGQDIEGINISAASDSGSTATTPGIEQAVIEFPQFSQFEMSNSRPVSLATNVSVELGGYQVALEEVLTWLLEAEDVLSHAADPGSNLELLKRQFHEHESFLVELSGHQDGVGAVLEEGERLLAEGGLQKDEEHEVRVQMSLLNSRWESLRKRALDRQSKIHKILMEFQQMQLNSLRHWLTKTEDRISRMGDLENNSALNDQLKQLKELEEDIKNQQTIVDGLKNMVNAGHIFVGGKRSVVKMFRITLKQMEASPASEIGQVLERIKKLQLLKMEMDMIQKKLTNMQTAIRNFEGHSLSYDCIKMLEKLENLEDQCEAVVQIMEVQSQRISNSGFEVDLFNAQISMYSTNDWINESIIANAQKEEIAGIILYEDNMADVNSHEAEYEKVIQLGKRFIDELRKANEQYDEEDAKLKNVETCWLTTNARLKKIKENIDFLMTIKEKKLELTSLRLMLDGHYKWFDVNYENCQIELFRVKIKSIESCEDRVEKLTAVIKGLTDEEVVIDEIATLKLDIDNFISDRNSLLKKLLDKAHSLTNAADKIPPKKYNDTINALISLINNIESILLSEHAVMSDEITMQEKVKQFEELQLKIHKIKEELQDLNTKWSDVPIILEERLQKFSKDIQSLKVFDAEVTNLEAWLETSLVYLQEIANYSFIKDVETTEYKLRQIRDFTEEINKTKPNIENLQTLTNSMLENSEPNFASLLNGKLENISHKWNAIIDETKIINGIEDFTIWLSNLESEIPVEGKVTSSIELFQIRGRYQMLKDKIDRRVEEFRNLNELGSDKLLSSEGSSVHELGRRFTHLNARWTDVTDRIYERYKHFQNASHEYGEFRALVAHESDWLDKLEKKLRKSNNNAADAEDISEELDADERAKILEGSVKQAEQSEGRILALQHSLTQVDSVLTARLDCDLTAEDLPHDYQKLMKEMNSQQSTLDEMATQIEIYKTAGKFEAAQRLQEQMDLIKQKFEEVQNKFQRFRNPVNIEPRLSRALRELRGIEEATCLLELATEDPDAIERQLKHCLSIIVTGRKLVEEENVLEPKTFSKRIDTLKELYNKETLTEVIPRLNAVKDKLFKTQDEFSKLCDPTYLDQLKEKLSDIIDRLTNTEKRLRMCNESNEEPNVDEINTWLLQMEEKLDKLNSIPMEQFNDQYLEQCKIVQTEIMESQPKIVQLQYYSYYSKVAEVCRKWEDISNRIRIELGKMHQRTPTYIQDKKDLKEKKIPFKIGGILQAALEKEIIKFEELSQEMLNRMDIMLMTVIGVTNEKDPSKRLEVLKGEISCLASDAATLISRGDGLVMTVHGTDPLRADTIKYEHQDKLRSKWHQIMQECETKRSQALKAEDTLYAYNQLIAELEDWFRLALQKLEQANNYEGQLEAFTLEFDLRQEQIKKLNQLQQDLMKFNVAYNETIYYTLNSKWQEISSQFKRFSGSKDKDKQHTDKKVEMSITDGALTVQNYVTRANKLRDAIATLSKSFDSMPLNGKDFELFTDQDECLKKISSALNILKPSVEEIAYLGENISENQQARPLNDSLKNEWTIVNQNYIERYNRWAKCNEKLNELRNACWNFDDRLLKMEVMMKEIVTNSQSKFNLTKMLEMEIPRMLKTMNGISATITDVTNRSSPVDIKDWQRVIDDLKMRWQKFVRDWNMYKNRFIKKCKVQIRV
ncbi:PREDICTED: dystrophin-like [Ceratosolen solmsi marchali]|uniref:Dystrophin-like n=1 Tax=Ceratosolen solmsi marchali TaxID=326594 RepID=A0AAJ6YSE8_9HYME|nr:PREDICTED: dystrophin-like [Ceratosolen solmsi marchali]